MPFSCEFPYSPDIRESREQHSENNGTASIRWTNLNIQRQYVASERNHRAFDLCCLPRNNSRRATLSNDDVYFCFRVTTGNKAKFIISLNVWYIQQKVFTFHISSFLSLEKSAAFFARHRHTIHQNGSYSYVSR